MKKHTLGTQYFHQLNHIAGTEIDFPHVNAALTATAQARSEADHAEARSGCEFL